MVNYLPKLDRINPNSVNYSFFTDFSGSGTTFAVNISGSFLNYTESGQVYKINAILVDDVTYSGITFVPTSPLATVSNPAGTYQINLPSPTTYNWYSSPVTKTVGIQVSTSGGNPVTFKTSEEYLRFTYIYP